MDHGQVTLGQLLVPGRPPAEFLEPADAPLDRVPPPVRRPVERVRPAESPSAARDPGRRRRPTPASLPRQRGQCSVNCRADHDDLVLAAALAVIRSTVYGVGTVIGLSRLYSWTTRFRSLPSFLSKVAWRLTPKCLTAT
jgi:hypothetical protein